MKTDFGLSLKDLIEAPMAQSTFGPLQYPKQLPPGQTDSDWINANWRGGVSQGTKPFSPWATAKWEEDDDKILRPEYQGNMSAKDWSDVAQVNKSRGMTPPQGWTPENAHMWTTDQEGNAVPKSAQAQAAPTPTAGPAPTAPGPTTAASAAAPEMDLDHITRGVGYESACNAMKWSDYDMLFEKERRERGF